MLLGMRHGHDVQGGEPFGKDHEVWETPGASAAGAMPPGPVPARRRFDLRNQAADFHVKALGRADVFSA